MTFQEMLADCDPDKAINAALAHDIQNSSKHPKVNPKTQREGYEKVFYQLFTIEPKESKMTMLVENIEDWYDKKMYPHVHGKVKGDELQWSLMLTKWEEFLGMEVKTDFPLNETVGHVLWEMTFCGFCEKDIEREMKKI